METNFILIPVKATDELPKGRNKKNDFLSPDVMCMVKGDDMTIKSGNYSYATNKWLIISIVPSKGIFESEDVIWFKKVKTSK